MLHSYNAADNTWPTRKKLALQCERWFEGSCCELQGTNFSRTSDSWLTSYLLSWGGHIVRFVWRLSFVIHWSHDLFFLSSVYLRITLFAKIRLAVGSQCCSDFDDAHLSNLPQSIRLCKRIQYYIVSTKRFKIESLTENDLKKITTASLCDMNFIPRLKFLALIS